jgi:hypothetical protein
VSRLKIAAAQVPDDVGEWEVVDDDGKEKVLVEKRPREWS